MKIPVFFHALYRFAPGFGCHVRQPPADAHPLLTEQVLLSEPLAADPFGRIHTVAQGRSAERRFVWFAEWTLTDWLLNTYYAFEKQGDETVLLVFHQPQSGQLTPFHLLICPVDDAFPNVTQLWTLVADKLAEIPAIEPVD